MALERLQKIIAAAGIASRRKAEEMIQQGLVSVNGKTVTQLGTKADPETDSIRVNEKLLKGAERHEYVVLNKPRGYVTTVSDPEGRPTIMELVRSRARLYPVGRLDFNSEGLLLLTNDGELAHKLMKAASNVPKTYLVKVAGQPSEEGLRRLRAGVSIAEERHPGRRVRTASAQIRVIKEAANPWLEVTLHEGRNRQIRKMFEEIGHHVEKIRRVRYGPLELDLPPGESRSLNAKEMAQLQRATDPRMQAHHRVGERRPSFDDSRRQRPRRVEVQREREDRVFRERKSDKPFERRERPEAGKFKDRARPNRNAGKPRPGGWRDNREEDPKRTAPSRQGVRNEERREPGFRRKSSSDSRSKKFVPRGERKALGPRKHQSRRDSNRPRPRKESRHTPNRGK
jgi:23S rRNA pseudouridine2605 synthase